MLLKDKVAIVTGGTRGIGLGTVKLFLEQGAKVALCGSRQETVDKALQELGAINADFPVIGRCPDLMDEAAVKAFLQEVKAKWGRIDILVNNAGISDATPIYDYTAERFQNVMDINVQSLFNATMAVMPLMKEQGGGVILNTSSVVSIYAQSSGCAYPTSKFAVNGLTKALARECGKDNIRINAVAPGVIETDMVEALPEEIKKTLAANIPIGRLGRPDDIANAFLFLASDMASYITGAVLSVDGATVI